jgi:hypothetical protein
MLQKHRFCNTFRLTDATCQYMIKVSVVHILSVV